MEIKDLFKACVNTRYTVIDFKEFKIIVRIDWASKPNWNVEILTAHFDADGIKRYADLIDGSMLEEQIWEFLNKHIPAFPAVIANCSITSAVWFARLKMLAETSPAYQKDLQDQLLVHTITAYEEICLKLGALDVMRAEKQLRYNQRATVVFWPKLARKVNIPYESRARSIAVKIMPSPFKENTFDVRTTLDSSSMDYAFEANERIMSAYESLRSKGFMVETVLAGTEL